jgi:hypothetical protein
MRDVGGWEKRRSRLGAVLLALLRIPARQTGPDGITSWSFLVSMLMGNLRTWYRHLWSAGSKSKPQTGNGRDGPSVFEISSV